MIGDEAKLNQGRGDEILVPRKLKIKSEVAGNITRAVNTLSSLIQSELWKSSRDGVFVLVNSTNTSEGIAVERTTNVVVFRPVDLIPTESETQGFHYKKGFEETFVAFTPETVLIGSDTTQTKSPNFHSLSAQVRARTLILQPYPTTYSRVVLPIPIDPKPDTIKTEISIEPTYDINAIRDYLDATSRVGAFADYILSHEWVAEQPTQPASTQ